MDWRCPHCGSDNEENGIKCPCGYVREEPSQTTNIITDRRKIGSERILLRWSLLLLSLVGSLYLLNVALFCAWASGGPPTEYPKAWLQRSYTFFGFSGALIATGIMGFIGLKSTFNWKRSVLFYIWVPFITYCLVGPNLREYILVDKCLDSGGMWDKSHFECRSKKE
jgi:hypothetical protein